MFLVRAVRLIASLLILVAALNAEILSGVLLSNEHGPSGDGAGLVRIATTFGVSEIQYVDPLSVRFANQSCRDIGARWKANVAMTGPGRGRLLSVECDGESDRAIRSAWRTAYEFLNFVAERNTEKARAMRGARWRGSHSRSSPQTIEMVDLRGYENYGRGECLVVNGEGPESIVIDISENCLARFEEQPATVRLIVTQSPQSNWEIDRVLIMAPVRKLSDDGEH